MQNLLQAGGYEKMEANVYFDGEMGIGVQQLSSVLAHKVGYTSCHSSETMKPSNSLRQTTVQCLLLMHRSLKSSITAGREILGLTRDSLLVL